MFYNLEYIMLLGVDRKINDKNIIQPSIDKTTMF
jgi:hypothetical protein